MIPISNGIVEIYGEKRVERGFNCMMLIQFLSENNVKDWSQWHGAHIQAAAGQCPYQEECQIHANTLKEGVQLTLPILTKKPIKIN